MNILVSACLLGLACRYNGQPAPDAPQAALMELMRRHTLIPVCPELLGGLPVPREPVELCQGRACCPSGRDVTASFQAGAAATLSLAQSLGCALAILKERSPSCGAGLIYDGSFSSRLIPGNGLAAQLLLDAGIPVLGESRLDQIP